MLAVALLCCLALVQGGTVPDHEPYADDQDSDDHEFDNMMDRLRELDIHMNRLIAKTVQVHDEFNDKVHDREAAQTKATNLKLRMAKGDHVCKKGYFRCNSAEDQCVSDMLVCDGEKDCHDGSDEDELVCTNPFTANRSWNASRVYDHCYPWRFDTMLFTMVTTERDEHYPSRVFIGDMNFQTANLPDEHLSLAVAYQGYYYFCHRRSLWYSTSDPSLYWKCDFDDNTYNDLTCHAYKNTATEPCSKYHFLSVDIDQSLLIHNLQPFYEEIRHSI